MKANAAARYSDGLRSLLQTGTARQIIAILGFSVSVALGIVLYMSVQEPVYRPLDYQINSQNMGTIVDTLDKANVQYKINDRDGLIYVSAKDLQLAKIKLSSAGVQKDDSISYSFLNEQNSFGNTQFIENARYLKALEGDLSKTISAIEGVSGAKVHIAMPQNTTFADENNKVTASIVLNVTPGFASDKERVRSIMQILSGSVPGLDPKNVAITDQFGHPLSDGMDQDSIYNGAQLSYQNNMQNYYEKRIESMILPLLGENKVTVRVYADIDYTQHEEAQESYDPDKKVVRSEQTLSEQTDSQGGSGAPGSLSNGPPSEGEPAKSSSGGGSQGRSQTIKNYELGKSVSYVKSNSAKIKSLSVAVVVDNEMTVDPKTKQQVTKPVEQEKLTKIQNLVEATIGYNKERGDKVTVVNSVFKATKQEVPEIITHFWELPWFYDAIKKIVGVILGFIVLLVLYKKISKYLQSTPVTMTRHHSMSDDMDDEAEHSHQSQEMQKERLNKLKKLASSDPDKVAVVIKNWVGKQ